jgi:hypothetical protein
VEEELFYADDLEETVTIQLRCLFNNKQIDTSHIMQQPSASQLNEYRSLMKQSYLVRGSRFQQVEQKIPSKAKKLGQLYDALMVETEGYIGRVPLHHKIAVVLEHLKTEAEITGKN